MLFMQKTCSTVNGSPSIIVLLLDICMERERVFDKRQQGVKGKRERRHLRKTSQDAGKRWTREKRRGEISTLKRDVFPTFPTSFSKPNSTPFHFSFPPPQCLCLSFLLLLLLILPPPSKYLVWSIFCWFN